MDVAGHTWEMKKKRLVKVKGVYRKHEKKGEWSTVYVEANCMGSSIGAVMKEARNDSHARVS